MRWMSCMSCMRWWLVWVVGCGEAVSSDEPAPAESSSTASAPACAGGPACGDDEVCVTAEERCECDPGFEHCDLVELTPQCAGVPFDCTDAVDEDACHVALVCGTMAGRVEDGVLSCDPVDACVGSCDSVEGCQTAGGNASQSDSESDSGSETAGSDSSG